MSELSDEQLEQWTLEAEKGYSDEQLDQAQGITTPALMESIFTDYLNKQPV